MPIMDCCFGSVRSSSPNFSSRMRMAARETPNRRAIGSATLYRKLKRYGLVATSRTPARKPAKRRPKR